MLRHDPYSQRGYLFTKDMKKNWQKTIILIFGFAFICLIFYLVISVPAINKINSIFISEDDRYLLIANYDGRARVYDLTDGSLVTNIGPKGRVWRWPPPTKKGGIKGLKPIKSGFIYANSIILDHFGYGIKCYDMTTKNIIWAISGISRYELLMKIPMSPLFAFHALRYKKESTSNGQTSHKYIHYIEIRNAANGQLINKINIDHLDRGLYFYTTKNSIVNFKLSLDRMSKIYLFNIDEGKILKELEFGKKDSVIVRYIDSEKFCLAEKNMLNFYKLNTAEIIKRIKYDFDKESFLEIKFINQNTFIVADRHQFTLFDYGTGKILSKYAPLGENSVEKFTNTKDWNVIFNNNGSAFYLIDDKMEYKKVSLKPLLSQSSHQ